LEPIRSLFGTSSYVTGSIFTSANPALSASYALSASNAQTASYIVNAQSASYVLNAQTASYIITAQTASYVNGLIHTSANPALSASYALISSNALTASFVFNPQTASYIVNAQSASYVINAQTASYIITAQTASYVTGSIFTSTNRALSASNALTASFAPLYLPLTGGTINGNLTIAGTASIAYLDVRFESASVIYSSGSNQFGDATNDTQTLIGTVIVSGSQQITGSLNVSQGITGSLF